MPSVLHDDPAMRVLLAAVRREGSESSTTNPLRVEAVTLLAASWAHRIDHLLYDYLRSVAPDHPAVAVLGGRADAATRAHLRSIAALNGATGVLSAAGVASIVLKGPVLAACQRAIDPKSSVRPYGDLDLLVKGSDLGAAADALCNAKAQLFPVDIFPYRWRFAFEAGHAEIPFTLPLGVSLDLHWHLCSRPAMRRVWRVDTAELIGRAEPVAFANGMANVLQREDNLVHVAAHAGWSGGDRLGWLVDVDAVVRSAALDGYEINWDVVVARANEWGLAAHVGDVLRRSAAVLGSPVPLCALRELNAGALPMILRTVDWMSPMRAELSVWAIPRTVRLAATNRASSTLLAATRKLARAAARRVPGLHVADDIEQTSRVSDAALRETETDAESAAWRSKYLSMAASTMP